MAVLSRMIGDNATKEVIFEHRKKNLSVEKAQLEIAQMDAQIKAYQKKSSEYV